MEDNISDETCAHGSAVCEECAADKAVNELEHKLSEATQERDQLKQEMGDVRSTYRTLCDTNDRLKLDLAEAVRIARENDHEVLEYSEDEVCSYCIREFSFCKKEPCKDRQFLSRFPAE